MSGPSSTVSIVTRTRDRHLLLARAIESVLGQSHTVWQHVIVNDGGNAADLDEFLAAYTDRYAGRLKVVHNERSLGMQAAANKGVSASTGDYLVIHDDDDAWHPEFLSSTIDYLESAGTDSDYQGVITHTLRVWEDIDSEGNIVEVSRENYLPLDEISLFRVGFENPFAPIAFVYRRSAYDALGGYDARFDVAGDMDFNIRFLQRYEIGVIPRKLAYYHWRREAASEKFGNSVTAGSAKHGRCLNELLNVYLRGDSEQIGLALNLARYAVGAQGRIDAIIERIADLKLFAGDQHQELRSILLGDGENRRGELAQRTEQMLERIADLKQFTGDNLQHGLADLKGHIASQNERLSDLKAHLDSHTGQLFMQKDILARMNARLERMERSQPQQRTLLRIGPLRFSWEKRKRK